MCFTQILSSFLLGSCFHSLKGFLFMGPGSWLHSIHFPTVLVCLHSALQQLAWGEYPEHTHIHMHTHNQFISYGQIIFSAWLVSWPCLNQVGLWFWGVWLCISFLPVCVGGQTSMEDRNHCFKVSYIKNTIYFRRANLVIEDSCGLSVPSHFRNAMEVGWVRLSLSEPSLLQKP